MLRRNDNNGRREDCSVSSQLLETLAMLSLLVRANHVRFKWDEGKHANHEKKRRADEGMLVAPFAAASCSDQVQVSRASSLEQA